MLGRRYALVTILATMASSLLAQSYTVVPLIGFAGDFTASGLARNGTVSGYAYFGSSDYRAFTWRNGTINLYEAFGRSTSASASNTAGVVVGGASINSSTHHAVAWQNGIVMDLGSAAGPTYSSHANCINESGWIAGQTQSLGPTGVIENHPFVYHDGVMHDIGLLPGYPTFSYGDVGAINDLGHFVGSYENGNLEPPHPYRPYLWTENTGPTELIDDNAGARGINDSEQVVGTIGNNYVGYRGFLWQNGIVTDLGPGHAESINNAGDILGSDEVRAVIWRGLIPYQLDTLLTESGWSLSRTAGINDAGQILAFAYQSPTGSYDKWVLLNPVPEPTSVFVLSVLTAFGVQRRKKAQ